MRLKKAKKNYKRSRSPSNDVLLNVENPSMELSRKEKLMSPPFFVNYSEVPLKVVLSS